MSKGGAMMTHIVFVFSFARLKTTNIKNIDSLAEYMNALRKKLLYASVRTCLFISKNLLMSFITFSAYCVGGV